MQIIYADAVFAVNTLINYLILLSTAKICAAPTARLRLAAAAAIGGAYAVAAALPPLKFLENPLIVIAAGLLIVTAAFGGQPRLARITVIFFAISATFAGAAMAISLIFGGSSPLPGGMLVPVRIDLLLISFAVCYAATALVFRRTAGNKGGIVPLTVRQGDRVVELRALVDSGNSLTDPMTGVPVIVTGVADAKNLFPKEIRTAVEGVERRGAVLVMEEIMTHACPMRFRLIPYSAVGISGGMLLAFRPDEVVIDGEKKSGMLVALSPNSISDNGTYTALIGA